LPSAPWNRFTGGISANFTYDPATQLVDLHIRGILKRAEMVEFFDEVDTEQARAWLLES
jgi:hypothetical protein